MSFDPPKNERKSTMLSRHRYLRVVGVYPTLQETHVNPHHVVTVVRGLAVRSEFAQRPTQLIRVLWVEIKSNYDLKSRWVVFEKRPYKLKKQICCFNMEKGPLLFELEKTQ